MLYLYTFSVPNPLMTMMRHQGGNTGFSDNNATASRFSSKMSVPGQNVCFGYGLGVMIYHSESPSVPDIWNNLAHKYRVLPSQKQTNWIHRECTRCSSS